MSSYAGVDVGGTKILVVVIDGVSSPRVVAKASSPTPRSEAGLLREVAALLDPYIAGISAVGIGVAGLVNRRGILRVSPNLPWMRGVNIGAELAATLGSRRVVVENDASAAAWAEHVTGAGVDTDDMLGVSLGTGIGVGLVADGELVRGAHGFAGEAGHMVVCRDGLRCNCGRRGCWELYASGDALGRLGRESARSGGLPSALRLAGGDVENLRGEHITAAATAGEPDALRAINRYATWVALGIGNLVTILDARLVVISGGLAESGELLLGPIRDALTADVMYPSERNDVEVRTGVLGREAGAVGAALLAGLG